MIHKINIFRIRHNKINLNEPTHYDMAQSSSNEVSTYMSVGDNYPIMNAPNISTPRQR